MAAPSSDVSPPMPSLDEVAEDQQNLQQQQSRSNVRHPHPPPSPFRPDEELHFGFPTTPDEPEPPHQSYSYSHLPHAPVKRISSVPELQKTRPGLPSRPGMYRQNSAGRPFPRPRVDSGERQREGDDRAPRVLRRMEADPGKGVFEAAAGLNRLIREKSIERGMMSAVTSRPSSRNKRVGIASINERKERHESRSAAGSPSPVEKDPPTPTGAPGLKMPLAFNSIARERGFTTGTHPGPQGFAPLPHPRYPASPHGHHPQPPLPDLPSDLGANNENRQNPPRYPRDPVRAHLHQASSSANTSPHNSFAPPSNAEEIRTSFRSALSASEENRSSTATTSSEAATESSIMTVDEAIGMYASDTDEDEMSPIDDDHRRSKGDSVLGGARSREGSVADDGGIRRSKGDSVLGGKTSRQGSFVEGGVRRSKGDSVLGGEVSPETRSRLTEQELALQHEVERLRVEREMSATAEFTITELVENAPKNNIPETDEPGDMTEIRSVGYPSSSRSGIDQSISEPKIMPSKTGLLAADPDTPQKNPPLEFGIPPSSTRDRYGFQKQTQYITLKQYDEWNIRYEEILERRRKKWDVLLRESGLSPGEEGPVRFPPKSAKIKRYVRKGIPPEWRGAAWFWYAGGQKYINKNAGLYEQLVKRGLNSPDAELIERDLHRTFPDNIRFKPDQSPSQKRLSKLQQQNQETEIVRQLRRVLVAFSLHVPKIGYCQSLNFLAGLLLLFMSEEKAFWMLYIMTHTYLPGTHELTLEGSSVDQWVLMMSVRESLPTIWSKIGGGLDGSEVEPNSATLPPVTLSTTSWFMSAFIGSLPIESVLRVWDCLFYEGSKTLFRIALAVLKTGEPQIKAVNDPMEIFQVVQTIPRKLIDAGALIEACYRRRNGFGHISQETLDERRQDRRDTLAAERAALARGDRRVSKDDSTLRSNIHGPNGNGHHDLGRKFRKILVKV